MSALIFSSDQMWSLSGPLPLRYKVEISGEGYVGLNADIIGGIGPSTFYVAGDWRDFIQNGQGVLLTETGVGTFAALVVNPAVYNSGEDRTEIDLNTAFDAKWDTIEGTDFAPIFEPLIKELTTEWEDQGDILLSAIKPSHSLLTYYNDDEWFERFYQDLFLNSNDDEWKMVIYRRNDADTDWNLEWVGNMTLDLTEWDNMDKPRPYTFKAYDGINMLKTVHYAEALTGTADQPLISHLLTALSYINTSQFWPTPDPYIRESNEYVSTDIAGLTDSDSAFEYAFFDDRVFIERNDDDIIQGIFVFDVIKAIMEILSCRIFLAEGVWWVQQIRNFANPTTIVYREFTNSLGVPSTRGTYSHKKTVGQGDRAKDLVQMVGGKFNNHKGLLNVKILAEQPGLIQSTVADTIGRLSHATTTFQRTYELGNTSGGVGSDAKIRIEFMVDELINPEPLGTYFFECQLKIIGGGNFIAGSDVVDPFWGGFINDDIIGGVLPFTFFIDGDRTSDLTTSTLLLLVDSPNPDTPANVTSFSYNAGQDRTEIVTDVAFDSKYEHMVSVVANSFWSKKINSTAKGNKTMMVYETPEIPYNEDTTIILDFFLTGNTSVGFEYWRVYDLKTFVPSDDGDIADIEYNVGNPNSDFTDELDLGTLLIDDESKVVAVNALQVDEEFTTANPQELVKSTVWDADFPTNETLTGTRALEAMSLQVTPVEILRSNIEGDYYPFYSLSYNDKIYVFAGYKFDYTTDEQDGEWFEVATARLGVGATVIKKIKNPGETVISGEIKVHTKNTVDNTQVLTTATGITPAGLITSIAINAPNNDRLRSGDTVDVVHPVSHAIVETIVLSADVQPTDITISIAEQTTVNDITEGMYLSFKKGEVVDAKIIRGDQIVGAGGVTNEMLFNNAGLVDGTEFLTVDEALKTFRFSSDLVGYLDVKGNDLTSNQDINLTSGATFDINLLSGSNKVGVNTTVATAVLDLDGATSGRASLRIRDQVAVSSPNDGDVYNDTADNKLKFYNGTVTDILSVAGLDTEVQFNNGGIRSTSTSFIYDHTNNRLKLGGSVLTAVLNVKGANALNGFSALKVENSAGTVLLDTQNDGEFLIDGRIEQTGLGDSVFIGKDAGKLDDGTGNKNIGLGFQPLFAVTSGSGNFAGGWQALGALTIGGNNLAFGQFALLSITTTSNLIGLGRNAGRFLDDGVTANQTSSNSVYIGIDTRSGATASRTNETVIGYQAISNGSNTVTLGNSSVTDVFIAGDWHVGDRLLYSATITLGNNATPTVAEGNVFVTGGTTAITDFDDGVVGQTIQILAEHTITITDGTPIQLMGGDDFNMVSQNSLTLTMFNDQIWHETART